MAFQLFLSKRNTSNGLFDLEADVFAAEFIAEFFREADGQHIRRVPRGIEPFVKAREDQFCGDRGAKTFAPFLPDGIDLDIDPSAVSGIRRRGGNDLSFLHNGIAASEFEVFLLRAEDGNAILKFFIIIQ